MVLHTPREVKKDELVTGEVGWIAASIKSISDVHVGDTVTTLENKASEPLPGYRRMNPMVYCGLYPIVMLNIKIYVKHLKRLH